MRNIVYVCPDGAESAKQLYDGDVIGMPITIAFLLQGVWYKLKPGQFDPPNSSFNLNICDIRWFNWVLESKENYEELWNYGMDVMDEHAYRFGDQAVRPYKHASHLQFDRFQVVPPLPEVPATPRPETPLNEYATQSGFWAVFTNRERPSWAK